MKAAVRFSRSFLINLECFTLRLCIFNDLAFSASLVPAQASPIEMHTALISSLSHSTFFYLGLIISQLVYLLLLIARAGFSMAFFGRYVPCFASALSLYVPTVLVQSGLLYDLDRPAAVIRLSLSRLHVDSSSNVSAFTNTANKPASTTRDFYIKSLQTFTV